MSGDLVAVVPVRSLRGGKTRLAEALPPEAREALSRRMLLHVLEQIQGSGVAAHVVVVSPDPEALAVVQVAHPGVVTLAQPEVRPGLNAALDLGREWALAAGAAAVVVLFADLPRLTAEEVRVMAAAGAPVVLAPDRHGTGTNALLLRLAAEGRDFAYAFGDGSAALHLAEARRLGLEAVVHRAAGLSFDLDTGDDWRSFVEDGSDTATIAVAVCAGRGGRR